MMERVLLIPPIDLAETRMLKLISRMIFRNPSKEDRNNADGKRVLNGILIVFHGILKTHKKKHLRRCFRNKPLIDILFSNDTLFIKTFSVLLQFNIVHACHET